MSQIQEPAGNTKPVIDHKKVLMARKGTWTLEKLGIELKDVRTRRRKRKRRQRRS